MAIEGKDTVQTRPIRLGMVGGGKDALSAPFTELRAHRRRYDLVAGALSSTRRKLLNLAARSASRKIASMALSRKWPSAKPG